MDTFGGNHPLKLESFHNLILPSAILRGQILPEDNIPRDITEAEP